jgi:hypothetical protein
MTMPVIPSNTRPEPWYKRNHIGGSVILGLIAVASLLGQMAGPPAAFTKDQWDLITFGAIVVGTFLKAMQSNRGASAVQEPK